jgi:hypothetical protein
MSEIKEIMDDLFFSDEEKLKLEIPLVNLKDGLDGLFDETRGYIVYKDQFEKAIEELYGPFINAESLRKYLNVKEWRAEEFVSKVAGFDVIINRKLGQNIVLRDDF